MKKMTTSLAMMLLTACCFAQSKPAYTLFDSKGKKVSYAKMIKVLRGKDLVFFGEFHNNPISHWLQLEVTKDCDETRDLTLGFEMFEQDNQPALDLYLEGKISAKGLDSMARLWKNYPTDYAPLINYAKENKIIVAADNIPRRYASMVAKGGFESLDTLPAEQKAWIAPLPIDYDPELPGYKNMLQMMPGHSGENLPRAQAIKDATMAYFILKYYQPGRLFIHFNGSYHTENHEGIIWYIQKKRPELKSTTITTVSQAQLKSLEAENRGKADFIICVDADMTNTY